MLRLAEQADAAELLRWRNDPVTRFYRDDARMIEPGEHMAWLKRRQSGPNKVYIYEHNGKPVGNVCLDVSDRGIELGWIVAPEYREKGIGKRMVMEALAMLSGERIWAKLRIDNRASQCLAEACAFIVTGKSGNMLMFVRPDEMKMAV